VGKLDCDSRLPGRGHGALVFQHHSFDEAMVFLRRDKRRAQLAPPGIDQRSGDVVLPSNLRDTRAGRKRLFQKRRCSSVLQRRRRSGPPKTVIRPTNTAPKVANNRDLKTDPSSHRQGAAQRMRTKQSCCCNSFTTGTQPMLAPSNRDVVA